MGVVRLNKVIKEYIRNHFGGNMFKLKKYISFILIVIIEMLIYLFSNNLSLSNYLIRASIVLFILSLIFNSDILKSFGNMSDLSQSQSRRINAKVDKMIGNFDDNKKSKRENKKLSYRFMVLGLINLTMYFVFKFI